MLINALALNCKSFSCSLHQLFLSSHHLSSSQVTTMEHHHPSLNPTPYLTPLQRFLSRSYEEDKVVQPNNRGPLLHHVQGNIKELAKFPLLRPITCIPPEGILLQGSTLYGSLVGNRSCVRMEGMIRSGDCLEEIQVLQKSSHNYSTSDKSKVVKGHWTAEEDSLLLALIRQYGVVKWSEMAKNLVGRNGKQCRERWHNHLRPDIKKETWTEEEEKLLVDAHKKFGNKWAEIAKDITGRSQNSIKNHWNATKRKQNTKTKTKRKSAKVGVNQSSILQDYIRSKSLDQLNDNIYTISKTQELMERLPSTTYHQYHDLVTIHGPELGQPNVQESYIPLCLSSIDDLDHFLSDHDQDDYMSMVYPLVTNQQLASNNAAKIIEDYNFCSSNSTITTSHLDLNSYIFDYDFGSNVNDDDKVMNKEDQGFDSSTE